MNNGENWHQGFRYHFQKRRSLPSSPSPSRHVVSPQAPSPLVASSDVAPATLLHTASPPTMDTVRSHHIHESPDGTKHIAAEPQREPPQPSQQAYEPSSQAAPAPKTQDFAAPTTTATPYSAHPQTTKRLQQEIDARDHHRTTHDRPKTQSSHSPSGLGKRTKLLDKVRAIFQSSKKNQAKQSTK